MATPSTRNGHIYVTTERDNNVSVIPKDEILEFDPASTATSLSPIHEYNVNAQYVPQLLTPGDSNLGFEGVGFVPDTEGFAIGCRRASTASARRCGPTTATTATTASTAPVPPSNMRCAAAPSPAGRDAAGG
jgi:DNA-binding beta-propeller fold protein YncE